MIFKSDSVQKVKLVMWSRVMLPDSEKEVVNGKTTFKKNGKEVEFTEYTFKDGFGDVITFLTKNSDFRLYEGLEVEIEIQVALNNFTNKLQTKLNAVRKIA